MNQRAIELEEVTSFTLGLALGRFAMPKCSEPQGIFFCVSQIPFMGPLYQFKISFFPNLIKKIPNQKMNFISF